MTAGNNPTIDRSKLGTKRHILTDKDGIPLSVVISSASTRDIKLVTDVVDNSVIKQRPSSYKPKSEKRRKLQHLCLDKAYNSKQVEQELIKRRYVVHITYKRKKSEKYEDEEIKTKTKPNLNRKKYSAKRWVVERTNSWHNRFQKLITRYEKKVENYLGLVQFSCCCIIIYRRVILG